MKKNDNILFCVLSICAFLAVTFIFQLVTQSTKELQEIPSHNEEEIILTDDSILSVFDPIFSEQNTPDEEIVSVFSGFQAPLSGRITSPFGYRCDPFTNTAALHRGVDIAAEEGTQVAATASGTVIASAYDSIGGNYIKIDHGDGRVSYYGHLKTRLVSKGDSIHQGDIIALSGNTGNTTGPHLHFQLYYQEKPVDPLIYVEIPS